MSKFKDSMGRWFTKGLFWETCGASNRERAIYTLKEQEHEGLPSLKALYLELATAPEAGEYDFATSCLGGWSHWTHLCSSTWFQPFLTEWREELEVKIRAGALKQIAEHAKGDKGYQAAKFLADRGWDLRKAGRPTKEEVKRERKIASRMVDEVDEHLERILN